MAVHAWHTMQFHDGSASMEKERVSPSVRFPGKSQMLCTVKTFWYSLRDTGSVHWAAYCKPLLSADKISITICPQRLGIHTIRLLCNRVRPAEKQVAERHAHAAQCVRYCLIFAVPLPEEGRELASMHSLYASKRDFHGQPCAPRVRCR